MILDFIAENWERATKSAANAQVALHGLAQSITLHHVTVFAVLCALGQPSRFLASLPEVPVQTRLLPDLIAMHA